MIIVCTRMTGVNSYPFSECPLLYSGQWLARRRAYIVKHPIDALALHSDGTIAKCCSKRRVTLENNDRILNVCRITETILRGPHDMCQCVVAFALSRISGHRNKRSRHGSVVLHSSHATANKQITESYRFYVSPLPFDIACMSKSLKSDGIHAAHIKIKPSL